MKLLVLTPEPVDAELLRATLGDEVEGAEVLVVSPATNRSKLAFWVSDPRRDRRGGCGRRGDGRAARGAGRRRRRRHRRVGARRRTAGRAGDVPGRPHRRVLPPRGRSRLPRGRGAGRRRGALRHPRHARRDRTLTPPDSTARTTNQFVLVLPGLPRYCRSLMDSVYEAPRTARPVRSAMPSIASRGSAAGTNSVSASQARAARRREARRDEQAVAAWLRELAGRTR